MIADGIEILADYFRQETSDRKLLRLIVVPDTSMRTTEFDRSVPLKIAWAHIYRISVNMNEKDVYFRDLSTLTN